MSSGRNRGGYEKEEWQQQRSGRRDRGGRGRSRDRASSSNPSESSSTSNLGRRFEEHSRLSSSSSARPAPTPATSSYGSQPAPAGSSRAPSSNKAIGCVRRPGTGKFGDPCRVRANHFLVRAADKQISQYEIKINPEVKSRAVCRSLMKKLIETFGKSRLGGHLLAYDGRGIVYTAGSLPFKTEDFEVDLSENDSRERKFTISINFVKSLDQYALAQFLSGRQTECPQDIITALDIVLRETPSNKYITVSRSFFSHQFGKVDMSGGLECWRGYFQSIRPTQMGLSLNADTSATPFYKSMSILNFITGFLNERHTLTSLSDRERHEIQKALNGVRVETIHLPNVRRRYRVTGISSQSAKELMFTLDETAGTKISVAQYFRTHCKYNLRHDSLPCIKAGSDTKPKYLPLEVCQIVDGQRYVKKLNEVQVSQILKVACTSPTERQGHISQLVQKNNYDNDLYAKNFGIGVQPNLTTVEARVLQPPRLKYHDSGAEKGCQPFGGKWSMNNKKVFRGGSVDAWACISFSRHYKNIVQDFCHEIVFACNRIGMVFNQNALIIDSGHHQRIENSIHDFVKACAKPLQLLVVILPEAKGAYGRIKKYCDTELGIVTQCCQSKHLNKPNRQYFENLALKINVKAGGCNTVLEDSVRGSIPVISEEPSIIFGADVTHPAPGEDSSSIAAVVASMDWPYVTKYKCLLSAQQRTREIIEKLYTKTDDGVPGGMIRELLFAFHKATGRKPNRIIFYRDGVSEGQFNIVLTSELDAIRRACASIQEGYLPPTTFIVVQKRHHTRLFPENTKMADRSGNILPGTVVDTKICHPNEFDFYLCSHAGIQGTSRPAHYHVLHDENNFTADQLQSLTNNLCYTYARCTRSVSIVPPAYYAHLAAFRARYYIDTGSEYASSQVSGKTRQRTATASAATTSAAPTTGLPAIPENVANVMFYC